MGRDSGDCAGAKRKRSKGFYIQSVKKCRKEFLLETEMKGFLVTCNNFEKGCIREAYNLLSEYADTLYGPEESKSTDEVLSKDDDPEKAIRLEVEAIKARSAPHERRFQVVESRARNCLFIKTKVPDPCKLVHTILQDIESSKIQKTRYLLRMLPVEATCHVNLTDVCKTVKPLIALHFTPESDGGKTFAIVFKARNNSTLKRNEVIEAVAKLVHQHDATCKANLTNAQLAIIVEVVCKVCCLSIVPDYFRYKKYNLLEMAGSITQDDSTKPEDEKAEDSKQVVQENEVTAELPSDVPENEVTPEIPNDTKVESDGKDN